MQPDQVKIRLLKSYFMRASQFLLSQQNNRRVLTTIEEDEEYVIITQDIPRQLNSEGDQESMQLAT